MSRYPHLAASNVDRDEVFVAEIPGYHRVQYQSVWEPDDPQTIPPDRSISLYAYPDDPTGDCQPDPHDSEVTGSCVVEQPSLTYTLGVVKHEYFSRRGTVLLRIVGAVAVDRGVLRAAILAARPTADPEIYTADIAGYEAHEEGVPRSMGFSLVDLFG